MEQEFNVEQWAEQQKETMEHLYDIIGKGVEKTLTDKFALQTYLHAQGRLGRTSLANTLLITAQMPEACYLASYDDWQGKERSVKKGEKSIKVIEAGREYTRMDGSMGVSFKPRKVFDVSQTHGKPMKERSFSRSVEKHINREFSATHFSNDFEKACAEVIIHARYGISLKEELPDIPTEIKNLDAKEKRDLLQDIRECAQGIIERVDVAYFKERQQHKNEQYR